MRCLRDGLDVLINTPDRCGPCGNLFYNNVRGKCLYFTSNYYEYDVTVARFYLRYESTYRCMMGREKVPKEICGKRSSGRDQNENIMHRDICSSEIDEFRKNDTTKKINDSKDCKIGGEDIRSRCPHVISIGDLAKVKIPVAEQAKCSFCENRVPARWICLHVDCLESSVSCVTLCGSKEGERCHACIHYAVRAKQFNNIEHCLLLNLVNSRLYCMCCETEVFREYNQPALPLELFWSYYFCVNANFSPFLLFLCITLYPFIYINRYHVMNSDTLSERLIFNIYMCTVYYKYTKLLLYDNELLI
uniref:UBP-type domain-containing protein n=1 Tax=Heterorhabditis bacteriophora TaxID=37862 RepID=A0A1I7WSB3_HETBA